MWSLVLVWQLTLGYQPESGHQVNSLDFSWHFVIFDVLPLEYFPHKFHFRVQKYNHRCVNEWKLIYYELSVFHNKILLKNPAKGS